MKKILALVLVTVIAGACLPVSAPTSAAPTVNAQATIDSVVQTSFVQTLAAQPTMTAAPVTDTATAILEPSATITPDTATPSSTPVPNLTTTPATATGSPGINLTFTATSQAGLPTLTPTLGVLTYGTLPPAVPFSQVNLVNKSKAQAYISLQLCDTAAKGAILEYPVRGTVKIKAPIGNYTYVVWVGGRQIVGNLTVQKSEDLTITIFKDKVTVK